MFGFSRDRHGCCRERCGVSRHLPIYCTMQFHMELLRNMELQNFSLQYLFRILGVMVIVGTITENFLMLG